MSKIVKLRDDRSRLRLAQRELTTQLDDIFRIIS
jgi:hypothetical protein